jgi:hypothetical protein
MVCCSALMSVSHSQNYHHFTGFTEAKTNAVSAAKTTGSNVPGGVGRAPPRSTCCSPRDFLKVAAANAQFTGTFAEVLNSASLYPVRWSDNRETAGGLGFFPLSFHDRDDQGQECDQSHARSGHGQNLQRLLHGLKNRFDEFQLVVHLLIHCGL